MAMGLLGSFIGDGDRSDFLSGPNTDRLQMGLLGLQGLAGLVGQRPQYTTNLAQATAPQENAWMTQLPVALAQIQRNRLLRQQADRQARLDELRIGKARREQQAEDELGGAASDYLMRNPQQTTMVNPGGIPTLPDAPDATRVGIPGTGGAANPAGLLKDPNYLSVMARRYPTQFAAMAQRKPNVGSLAPGATLYDYDNNQALYTAPDKTSYPAGYQPGQDGKLVPIPGGPADPSTIATQARARESENYREREFPMPGGQIQKQYSRDRGLTWQPLGEAYDRRGTGITVTQQARNGDIQAARRQLEGMSREDIVKAAQPMTPTGRNNPDYNPFIARAARLASRKLVGEDDPDHSQFWSRMIPNDATGDTATEQAPLGATPKAAAKPVPMSGGVIDRKQLKQGDVYSDGRGGTWRWTGLQFESVD